MTLTDVYRYHDGTKHDFNNFARSLGYLDWASQPRPFRAFIDAPLQPINNFWTLQEFLPRRIADSHGLGPPLQFGAVRRNEGHKVRPPVTDHDDLAENGIRENLILKILRRNILPTGIDDDVFLAARDLEKALRINLADIPGQEPAVSDCLAGCLIVLVVALHHMGTPRENFAV